MPSGKTMLMMAGITLVMMFVLNNLAASSFTARGIIRPQMLNAA